MNRRHFLALAAALAAALRGQGAQAQGTSGGPGVLPADHPLQPVWSAWKSLCLLPEGRVVDAFQNADSHSEGQGYGLALAATFGDGEAFERIRAWTEANLAVRRDALLAWRWRHDQQPPVPDRNNASDGDLFYAWGLCLAASGGGRPELISRATEMMTDLLRLCTAPHPDGSGLPLFLPGAVGFRTETGVIVNPSYYMARAMREGRGGHRPDRPDAACPGGRAADRHSGGAGAGARLGRDHGRRRHGAAGAILLPIGL